MKNVEILCKTLCALCFGVCFGWGIHLLIKLVIFILTNDIGG